MKQIETLEFDELLKGDKPVVCDFAECSRP